MPWTRLPLAILAVVATAFFVFSAGVHADQARDLDVGPQWLIADAEDLEPEALDRKVAEILTDDSLQGAVATRQRLYRDLYLTPLDARSRAVFLRGVPNDKLQIECGFVYQPIEIWRYSEEEPALVFYRVGDGTYKLWLPTDGKGLLFTDEMRYYMEQYEQFKRQIRGKRFDKRTCEAAKDLDLATGVDGLFKPMEDRPTDDDIRAVLKPPSDLAAWADSVGGDEVSDDLAGVDLQIYFPELLRQRMQTLFVVDVEDPSVIALTEEPLQPEPVEIGRGDGAWDGQSFAADGSNVAQTVTTTTTEPTTPEVIEPELRLVLEGVLEQEQEVFEAVRFRFRLPIEELDADRPGLSVSFSEALRPDTPFVARLRVKDPTSGKVAYLDRTFRVPRLPVKPRNLDRGSMLVTTADVVDKLAENAEDAGTELYLVPPIDEVVFGTLSAEAVVSGDVEAVAFWVDGKKQLTRRGSPYTAELRLATPPKEQIVRAEALDGEGNVVASDEFTVNQPRGSFSVRIVNPRRGEQLAAGRATVRAEVTLPPERRVEKVEFALDAKPFATLNSPPWQAEFQAPPSGLTAFLTVTATLTNGARVEDVRFLNSPDLLEEVDVRLVELMTTVTDGSGRPAATEVAKEDFVVFDRGVSQEISKFEHVENLPLVVGFMIDTSSSMKNALPEARRAVNGFLDQVIRAQDRVYTIAFSSSADVITPPTDDIDLARQQLAELTSYGFTTFNDAIVKSIFFASGFEGRKALLVLSDGEDTASKVDFETAMAYARGSGALVYTIGLGDQVVRKQLERLAAETGGRSYFVNKAEELRTVYRQIAEELRNQILIAYAPTPPGAEGEFHEVAVKVNKRGYRARTRGGYVY